MCGIAGFWSPTRPVRDGATVLLRMTDEIAHRGPDAAGQWSDPEAGIFLGHRRLSIIDLSATGAQPMLSSSGRLVITFNGEIYNYLEMRRALEHGGARFRGHSDTEVLLEAMEAWGIPRAIERAAGMFAFAVWDRLGRTLTLGRDRLGEKPLYYGWNGGSFLFGSELKALRRHPDWNGEIDRNALALFLRHNYIPAPYSIYKNAAKLTPGHVLTMTADRTCTETPYWSIKEVRRAGAARPFAGDAAEASDELHGALSRTVREQMVADVPLGAFLSGGIDSSLIVALMQANSTRPVKTFTIKFDEPKYDESAHARAVAAHLRTDHTEMTVTAAHARDVIPQLPEIYDEPFSDSSQIPTYLVSKIARSQVTVSLSGDGGDELFAGYPRYAATVQLWDRLQRGPYVARMLLSHGIKAIPAPRWDALLRHVPIGHAVRPRVSGDRLQKLAAVLAFDSLESTYRRCVTHWPEPEQIVLGAREHDTQFTNLAGWPTSSSAMQRLMDLDSVSYLPDDILVKVDRAAMAVSLETRAPFLDHRIVQLAAALPIGLNYRDGKGKRVLRDVLSRYVPPALFERPKMGFGIPVGEWLAGPLRDWAEALLDRRRLQSEGFFAADPIIARWEQHKRGDSASQYLLWDVLMFQAWLERQ